MTQRTPVVGGNWKMNTDRDGALALAADVCGACAAFEAEVVIFPPFVWLDGVSEEVAGSAVRLGAQDVFYRPDGAFTGEISVSMLKGMGVEIILCGHSERRHVIGESDELVNLKLRATLEAGLDAVLCVGETIDQREAGQTEAVVQGQLDAGLAGVDSDDLRRVVIAYEPVWAIGTGRTAQPEDAQMMHESIRGRLADLYDVRSAEATRIQYGGSVKAANAASLYAQPDVDGFLVGGASLDAASFASIVQATDGSSSGTSG